MKLSETEKLAIGGFAIWVGFWLLVVACSPILNWILGLEFQYYW
jgi:hypothetical protein